MSFWPLNFILNCLKNEVSGSHEIRLGHSQVSNKQTGLNNQAGWNNPNSSTSQT